MSLCPVNGDRLGVFFFYSADGKVRRFVTHFLDDIAKHMTEMVIVCNGQLDDEGHEIFSRYTPNVIVRENVGLDVYAYKTGIDFFGWDRLMKADELVMWNATIMGPFHPMAETFAKMADRDLDFWGLTKYYYEDANPFGNEYGYTPTHIQSHFIAYRQDFMKSPELQAFWNNPPEIHSYQDSVGHYESWFTKHFGDLGYKWDVSVDTDDLEAYTTYPCMNYARELIENRGCPIIKRKMFFLDYESTIEFSLGHNTADTYDYIRNHTDYDTSIIWDAVLPYCHQRDIATQMHLTWVLPEHESNRAIAQAYGDRHRLLLACHIYFDDTVEEVFSYAKNMPAGSDCIITTPFIEHVKIIEEVFSRHPWHDLKVRVIPNRGRDVSSLLNGVGYDAMNYDLVCYVHDKKSAHMKPASIGESFKLKCFENTLGSAGYVDAVIARFDQEKQLGLLAPPVPNHGNLMLTLGNEWQFDYEITKQLAAKLGFTVPMHPEKQPLAPLGTMFWFRPKAMKPLFDARFTYEDYPAEPIPHTDGTVLHAIERLYAFAVQQSGYYPAYAMTLRAASVEIDNLEYYTSQLNRWMFTRGLYRTPIGVKPLLEWMSDQPSAAPQPIPSIKRQLLNKLRPHVPARLWYIMSRCYHIARGK